MNAPTAGRLPLRDHVQNDVMASFVVFMVALPLCMGLALAAGMSPIAGVIGGVIGGIVVGALGGCQLQVSGPANGLIVVVALFIQQYGVEALGLVVLMAGGIQVAAGLLKVGQWFRAVTPAIILGMLTGFAVIIFASQIHVMLDGSPHGSVLANVAGLPAAIGEVFGSADASGRQMAAWIGLCTIAVLIVWPMIAPGRLKMFPASLLAVILATSAAAVFGLDVARVPVPDRLGDAFMFLQWSMLPELLSWELVSVAFAIAFIASAESLLSATALDQMHQGPRTNYNRELTAQGVGNVLCGLVGALPGSGVIVRSATNLQAGAKTRLSSMLHGVWMLVFVCLFPSVLRMIPTACLAAILVYTVCRLVKPKDVAALWNTSRSEAGIYAATAVGIVTTSVLTGVLIGVGLSLVKLIYSYASRLELEVQEDLAEKEATVRMDGSATFASLPRLASTLYHLRPELEVYLDCDRLRYIDHACLDLLLNWQRQREAVGGTLVVDWEELARKCPGFSRRRPTPRPILVVVGGDESGRTRSDS